MKFVQKLVEVKIRMDTGLAYMNWVKTIVLLAAGIKYLISLTLFGTILLTIALILGTLIIGWLALDVIKMPQIEAGLRDGKYNTFLKRVGEKILRKT